MAAAAGTTGDDALLRTELRGFLEEYAPHGPGCDCESDDAELCSSESSVAAGLDELEAACAGGDDEAQAFAAAFLELTASEAEIVADRGPGALTTRPAVADTFRMACEHTRKDQRKHVSAHFVSNLVVRRFRESRGPVVPKHVGISDKNHLRETFETIVERDDKSFDCGRFTGVEDQALLAALHQTTADLNWDTAVAHCFAVLPMPDGSAYSPAWNSIWAVYARSASGKRGSSPVLWVMHAADAGGNATGLYPGLVTNKYYVSRASHKFTPLGDPENYYGYALEGQPGGGYRFTIKVFFASDTPPPEAALWGDISDGRNGSTSLDDMQLQIVCSMKPATQEDIDARNRGVVPRHSVTAKLHALSGTLVKGGLMYDIMRQYAPRGSKPSRLFELINLQPKARKFSGAHLEAVAVGSVLQTFTASRAGFWLDVPRRTRDDSGKTINPKIRLGSGPGTRQSSRDFLGKIESRTPVESK
jgi:hypothetical protein